MPEEAVILREVAESTPAEVDGLITGASSVKQVERIDDQGAAGSLNILAPARLAFVDPTAARRMTRQ
jgi:hypothetical protein